MPKNTQYEEIKNLMLVVNFNQLDSEGKYQPVRIEARADVETTEHKGSCGVNKILNIGSPVNNPLTNKEIYTKVKAFNSQLGTLIKDLVLDALDEDLNA